MSDFAFDRSVRIPGGAEDAWALMTDVPTLVHWISVVGEAEEKEHLREYSAVIEDRVGMFALRANLDITMSDVREHEHITARATGQDRQIGSRLTIEAEVDLTAENDATNVRVHGHYEITGRAATLGSSQIKRKGEKVIDDFFANLERAIGQS